MDADALRRHVASYPWYHTLDLGHGVVTPGMFDHRGNEGRYLLPEDLRGWRCLDVGTMDGYWAFAMERRGADEVVAVDLDDPEQLDWPVRVRARTAKTMDETKGARFELARQALESKVDRRLQSVYELDDDLGRFDLVFCGDLLVHLKDPLTALERLRRVSRGLTVVCTPVEEHWPYRRRALARLDGIDDFAWWTPNLAGLRRMMEAAGFEDVTAGRPFSLPASAGAWKGRRGVVAARTFSSASPG